MSLETCKIPRSDEDKTGEGNFKEELEERK